MASHSTLSPPEAADRLAIRELFDAYAHCADSRDAEGQKALFTTDTRFAVYMAGPGTEPTYVLEGREALTPVFADLNRGEDGVNRAGGKDVLQKDGFLGGDEFGEFASGKFAGGNCGWTVTGKFIYTKITVDNCVAAQSLKVQ